jgi:GNAT superfamily N-acetyltransferase
MAGLLGDVFSFGDTLKRKAKGLLADPVGTLQQFVGNENDRAGRLNELTYAAAAEQGMGPQSKKLAGLLADSYNPAGIVTGDKIAKVLNAKYGDALDAHLSEGGREVYLSKLVVPKQSREQGIGTAFMEDLANAADTMGRTVTLTPGSDFGGSKSRLEKFYKRFDFVPNKGRNKDFTISEAMYRLPKETSQPMGGLLDDLPSATAVRDAYVGSHKAPMKGSGAPLHDLTQVYPDDIYSKNAMQYYGTGDNALDRGTFRKIAAYKGSPDAPVTMYRAVPKDVPEGVAINNGDWVTISPEYAKMHGEGALNGDYRIIQQQVPARKLFTNGDSAHEFGYDESGKIKAAMLGLLGAGAYGLGSYMQDK